MKGLSLPALLAVAFVTCGCASHPGTTPPELGAPDVLNQQEEIDDLIGARPVLDVGPDPMQERRDARYY